MKSFENLVTYDFTIDDRDYRVSINTCLIMSFYATGGYRTFKEHRPKRFLRDKFAAKYPLLSKVYNPHNEKWLMDSWEAPAVVFGYQNHNQYILCSSNDEAQKLSAHLNEYFFGT